LIERRSVSDTHVDEQGRSLAGEVTASLSPAPPAALDCGQRCVDGFGCRPYPH
jgi:hypothetical protein